MRSHITQGVSQPFRAKAQLFMRKFVLRVVQVLHEFYQVSPVLRVVCKLSLKYKVVLLNELIVRSFSSFHMSFRHISSQNNSNFPSMGSEMLLTDGLHSPDSTLVPPRIVVCLTSG